MVDLFRELPGEFEAREYEAGALIFEAEDVGRRVFILDSGTVHIYRRGGRHRLTLAELSPPALFGEMALVGDATYRCSAEATTSARVRMFSCAEVESLLERRPEFARQLIEIFSNRLLSVVSEFESASSRPLMPRLAELLLNRTVDDAVDGLTHQEIASRLRVHRESVSTTLGELRRAGILAVDRKRIRVLNRARLERASRERD